MADVADVAIEGFDVVAVRVEEVCRVVPRAVVPVAGLAVRAEAALDTRAVERVDLLLLPRVEAEVKVLRRRLASATFRLVKQVQSSPSATRSLGHVTDRFNIVPVEIDHVRAVIVLVVARS